MSVNILQNEIISYLDLIINKDLLTAVRAAYQKKNHVIHHPDTMKTKCMNISAYPYLPIILRHQSDFCIY